LFVLLGVLALVAAACSSSGGTTTTKATSTTAGQTTSTTAPAEQLELTAPAASITVDGDPSDWADIKGLDVKLQPIQEEIGAGPVEKEGNLKVAHDDKNIYVLVTVKDDYNFNVENAHKSGAVAVMFNIDGAPHMGGDDEEGDHTIGTVDIWHWELGCASGEQAGGAVNAPGENAAPGDDGKCNLDDEWATSPEDRDDDNSSTAENSLTGMWSHSNPVEDGDGEWYFEISRPLQTGDEQDAQLAVGKTAQMAFAYWDPDTSADGWDGDHHVQSSEFGWINVNLEG